MSKSGEPGAGIRTGGGFTTDRAHMFDIAQWGLGMDGNGPVNTGRIREHQIPYL